MMRCTVRLFPVWLGFSFLAAGVAFGQGSPSNVGDWKSVVNAAATEGKVVVSVPTSAELRTQLEQGFQKAFPNIKLELNVGRGSSNIKKIIEEHNAGVTTVDVHVGGTTSIITGLLANELLQPVMPALLRPDVKSSQNWWAGHVWADSAKKYVYSFTGYMTETVWFNSELVNAEEIASYDDLLAPKWKKKITILDPRTPGSGESTFSFLWRIKGEEYLAKLVAQEMMVGRNQRQLAEALARGKVSLSMGLSYYTFLPFIKAALPVKPIEKIKEGFYASTGSGNLVLLKEAPHPNAAKVFVNWLLTKEGQTIFTKALGQPTRRQDVDTVWTKEFGHVAAKDVLTPQKFDELENGSEDVVMKYRKPAMHLAEKLFK